jgi:uncharacterized protein
MNYQMKYRLAIKTLFLFAFVAFSWTIGFSKEVPKAPSPFMLVVDNANVLGSNEKYQLESKLRLFNDSSTTQISIVLDNSLEGDDIFDYSNRLAEAWGIGQKGKDNGILIYAAIQDRKVYIQVGYGLEGVVTDAASKKIIDSYILPAFKSGNYFQGLDQASSVLIKLSKNEFTADQFVKKGKKSRFPVAFIVMILLFVFFLSRGSGGFMGGLLMGSMWGSFSGGSGSFGGGNGGGFGGGSFGGGSFGGGGAGGSW